MKFEHILQIYWTKGYFFGGKLFYFNQNFNELFENTPGLGVKTKQLFIKRFELKHTMRFNKKLDLTDIQKTEHRSLLRPINILFFTN
jgi:hypothetical protein